MKRIFTLFISRPEDCRYTKTDLFCLTTVLLAVIFFTLPFLNNLNQISKNPDWLQTFTYAKSFKEGLLRYHQFPVWSNLFEGGYPIAANPYDFSLSPFSIFVLITNEAAGVKLIVFLFIIIGCAGMYYLTRNVFMYNRLAAMFSSLVFSLCSWWPAQARSGSYAKFYFCFLPLIFAFFIKSKNSKRFLVLCSFVLSVVVLQAGMVSFVVLLFLFFYAAIQLFSEVNKGKLSALYFRNFFIVSGLAVLLSAARIFPVIEILAKGASLTYSDFSQTYADFRVNLEAVNVKRLFLNSILLPKQSGFEYYDYGHSLMYIGFIPIFLSLSACLTSIRKVFRLVILLFIITVISAGNSIFFGLHQFLWNALWPFRQIYKLDKYFVPVILFLVALIGGYFFIYFQRFRKYKSGIVLVLFTLVFITAAQMYSCRGLYGGIFNTALPDLPKEKSFFQVSFKGGNAGASLKQRANYYSLEQYSNTLRGVGTINGVVPFVYGERAIPKIFYYTKSLNWRDKSLEPSLLYDKEEQNNSYRGEVFFPDDSNKLRITFFSPCRIKIRVFMEKPGKLVVNQNYYSGWRSSAGKISSYKGLLCVDGLSEGEYDLTVYYQPVLFYIGLLLSALTFCLSLFFVKGRKKQR